MLLERHHTLWKGSGLAMPSMCNVGLLSHIDTHAHIQTYTDWQMVTHMQVAQTHLQQTDLDDSTPFGSLNRASEHLLKTNPASFRKLFLFTPLIRGVVIYFHSHFMHPKLHECFSILTLFTDSILWRCEQQQSVLLYICLVSVPQSIRRNKIRSFYLLVI